MKLPFKLLFILLLLFSYNLFAEAKSYQLTGKIINKNSWAVKYATIGIYKDSVLIKGSISDESGIFNIDKLIPGNYIVEITHINYKKNTKGILISDENINLGTITLENNSEILNEISVKAERKLYKRDKRNDIFQISSIMSERASDVKDLLEQIPTLRVSQDYNLSVEGEGNILVLINGRKYHNINALRIISKDQIDKVLINNSPSVEYADKGYKSIVNILLKKEQNNSLNGNINIVFPNDNIDKANISLNYYQNKIRTFGGYNLYNHKHDYNITNSRTNLVTNQTINQKGDVKFKPNKTQNFFSGIDFFLNENHQFSIAGNFRNKKHKRNSLTDISNNTMTLYTNKGSRNLTSDEIQLSAYYQFSSKSGNNKITSEVVYTNLNQKEKLNYLDISELSILNQTNDTIDTDHNGLMTSIKYEVKLSENSTFNTGIKLNNDTYDNKMIDDNSSHAIDYKLNTYSSYVDFSSSIKKLSYWIGTAGELNRRKINSSSKNYWHFYPNIGFNYQINKNSNLGGNYQKSINHPDIYQLDPFEYKTDSLTVQYGNQNLDDYASNWIDFNYRYRFGRSYIKLTNYYNFIKDGINLTTEIDETGKLISSYDNFGNEHELGIKLNYSIWIYKWMLIMGNFNGYYQDLENDTTSDVISGSLLFYTQLYLPKNFTFMIGVNLKGKRVMTDGYYKPYSNLRLAIGKKIFNRKVSLYFNLENPILPYEIKTNQKTDTYITSQTLDFDATVAMFSIAYNFKTKRNKNKMLRRRINWKDKSKSLGF